MVGQWLVQSNRSKLCAFRSRCACGRSATSIYHVAVFVASSRDPVQRWSQSDVAGNDLPMALVQKAEDPRAQIGEYFLRVFLRCQLLPWDRIPEHPLLIFLRRLSCLHSHPPADSVRELEHGHMDRGGHGQSTGGVTDSVYICIHVHSLGLQSLFWWSMI